MRVSSVLGIGVLASFGLALVGCSDSCNDVGCPPKVLVRLPDFSASEGADLVLTACNAGVCVELAWNPACTYVNGERFDASWCLSDATRTRLAIEPHFAVADGDEYQVSIREVGGAPLLERTMVATYKPATVWGACEPCTLAQADFAD